jgi:hypothetical protein
VEIPDKREGRDILNTSSQFPYKSQELEIIAKSISRDFK